MKTLKNMKAYDRWAKIYDTEPNPHIKLEHPDVIALTQAKKGEYILDAACGTGKYAVEFAKRGARVIGIDLSDEMLSVARTKLPKVTFIQLDLEKRLPFRRAQFHKINCAQALKHIRKLKKVFLEFSRILKPGGFLIFSVTHPQMDWSGYKHLKNPTFNLAKESAIFHHHFSDYFSAIEKSGLKLDVFKQIPVSKRIKHMLTPASYKKVKGRHQIVVFRLLKQRA